MLIFYTKQIDLTQNMPKNNNNNNNKKKKQKKKKKKENKKKQKKTKKKKTKLINTFCYNILSRTFYKEVRS